MSIIHGKNLIVYIILRSFLFNFYSFIEKKNINMKNRAGGINVFDFRLYYKVTVIKTVWY